MNKFDPTTFFFQLPLYSTIDITNENMFTAILSMKRGILNDSFEGYNPFRGQDSTFKVSHPPDLNFFEYGGIAKVTIQCKRYGNTLYYLIYYDKTKGNVMKVGQYPSIADFHSSELKRYNKVLSKEKLMELSRAIGLAANGIGIGSFVYLRRIFENLILTSFDEHKISLNIEDKDFASKRMDDKIQTLKAYLPKFLVENKKLYSIMSTGIHELTEEDCLAYFAIVRDAIEIILDEKLEELNRHEKIKSAEIQISNLHEKLKKQRMASELHPNKIERK